MQTPTNLLGNHYGSSPRIVPTRAQEPGEWRAEAPVPRLPRAVPTLTVRPNGDVTLTKPLLADVPHLRAGAPVDVVPPMRRGGTWHLDTRLTAPRRLPASPGAVARFRIAPISREHLLIPATERRPGKGAGGALGTVGLANVLAFELGPEVMEQVCLTDEHGRQVCSTRGTGYFALLPVR